MILSLFGFVFLLRGILCCHALLFVSLLLLFSVLFSIVITSLGEERACL